MLSGIKEPPSNVAGRLSGGSWAALERLLGGSRAALGRLSGGSRAALSTIISKVVS
jgi:hypothetical protein